MRIRVVVALIFLIAAKAITVAVPVIYKVVVDEITNTGDAIVIVPIFLLVAYGGAGAGSVHSENCAMPCLPRLPSAPSGRRA